jgi:predicted hotdog family 3-hydroxylacyl-ACP dehydratase
MRFEVEGGLVQLPKQHPLATDGRYPTAALLELAAQMAGRVAVAQPGHRGMLVEVQDAHFHVQEVEGGKSYPVLVEPLIQRGPLQRFRVQLPGILEAGVTLRIAE